MLEQQLRAEVEAEGWRNLRQHLAHPVIAPTAPDAPAAPLPPKREWRFGAAMVKGIVRSGVGAAGAYLAFLAAADSGLGEFEIWLAVIAGFIVSLSLTAFGIGRQLVHALARMAAWGLVIALGVGAVYLVSQMAA
ncbi:hypothetical protein U91I_03559 [alpha proteobacterium U9-1i]|nr:hypothetical protein U91I_03559 [alpha proteobacterium U9-1i]